MSIHEQIRDILLQHIGKRNAIKSREIAKLVGINRGASSVNIRTKITETIGQYMLPIGGNTAVGYYLIENRDELKEYMQSLQRRINNTIERKNLVTTSFYKYYEDETFELTPEILENLEREEEEEEREKDNDV